MGYQCIARINIQDLGPELVRTQLARAWFSSSKKLNYLAADNHELYRWAPPRPFKNFQVKIDTVASPACTKTHEQPRTEKKSSRWRQLACQRKVGVQDRPSGFWTVCPLMPRMASSSKSATITMASE